MSIFLELFIIAMIPGSAVIIGVLSKGKTQALKHEPGASFIEKLLY